MDIERLIDEEIQDEFVNLKEVEFGSETHKTVVDGVTKLIDRSIELKKLAIERLHREEDRETEAERRAREIENERRNKLIETVVQVGMFGITTGVTIWGTISSFKFEETGSITTILGRGFVNKLLPRK